jgi:NAD(P)-dependent dehydrogenase (short-subunit alcohol dehydrogenase family)
MMTTSLNGRVVAITGAARGIGLATALELQRRGARLAIGDIDAGAVVEAAQKLGTGVVCTELDVTSAVSFSAFLALAESELGPVDVLINNAGIMPIGPFLEESDPTAARILDINVGGVLLGMKLALPAMLARGHGHIINLASVAGRSPVPGGLTYAASKAAIVSATESARVEFTGRGVDFTCVMPSFTATDLIAGTKGVRFISNVKPEQVATAIADAVQRPSLDVFVPKSVGTVIKFNSLTGRKVRDFMNHLIRADRTFLDVDRSARSYYEERVSRPVAADAEQPVDDRSL